MKLDVLQKHANKLKNNLTAMQGTKYEYEYENNDLIFKLIREEKRLYKKYIFILGLIKAVRKVKNENNNKN